MKFEDFWIQVESIGILPKEAIVHLPESFSDSVKRKMMRKTPQEVATKIQESIDEINRGSVETVEALLSKKL